MIEQMVTPGLLDLRRVFRASGFDLRFVGGCVRDALDGRAPTDIDLHTDATPDEQKAIYATAGVRFYETGIEHGTLTAAVGGLTYEITTLRRDVDTDGRHATVEFTREWEEDLARRDLTINAMSMSFEGRMTDPFDGRADLRARRVRFVGDPATRIKEDYLRILRFFRFHGRYAGETFFDRAAIEAIKLHHGGLKTISAERIWAELAKIIAHDTGPWMLNALGNERLDVRLPQPWNHGRLSFVHRQTRNPVTLVAAMLGDRAIAAGQALRWSNDDIKLARLLTETEAPPIESFYKRMLLLDGVPADWLLELSRLRGCPQIGERMQKIKMQSCPVNGHDLIARGYAPGPALGAALDRVRTRWALTDYTASKDALLEELEPA